MSQPLVLGIESSCDETAIGIVRGRKLLANVISSSVDEHARFGGVVPEIASRAHLEAMQPAIAQALNESGVKLKDLDGIAVTAGPGLVGTLLLGISTANALSLALDKPLYGVNHLAAHIAVDLLTDDRKISPAIALLVSGGHSSILQVNDLTKDIKPLGRTLDDAAGEAFDKVARLLNLGFPGGPLIDRDAKDGRSDAINFPRGLNQAKDMADHRFDFSFSGLKTAVSRYLVANPSYNRPDVSASFQEAVVDVLLDKAIKACLSSGIQTLVIAGGVGANSRLRSLAASRCEQAGLELRCPPANLCTDNGAMVAALGSLAISSGIAPSRLGIAVASEISPAVAIWA